jgi:hypothetical protein
MRSVAALGNASRQTNRSFRNRWCGLVYAIPSAVTSWLNAQSSNYSLTILPPADFGPSGGASAYVLMA